VLQIDIAAIANRPDVIIKNKKIESMYIDRRSNISGQECRAKGKQKMH
jgi:hypothetical protein